MEELASQLSPLTKFGIAIGCSLLLPKLMERMRPPTVLGSILAASATRRGRGLVP